jgi:hypothetical protein
LPFSRVVLLYREGQIWVARRLCLRSRGRKGGRDFLYPLPHLHDLDRAGLWVGLDAAAALCPPVGVIVVADIGEQEACGGFLVLACALNSIQMRTERHKVSPRLRHVEQGTLV